MGKKKLYTQLGDLRESPWQVVEVDQIGPSLSASLDVTQAQQLRVNMDSGVCYQGQTHGHEGFLLSLQEAQDMMKDEAAKRALHPYLTGDDLLSNGKPARYIINLSPCSNVIEAMKYGKAFQRVQTLVMPAMKKAAEGEREVTGKNSGPRQSHYQRWWKLWRGRPELLMRLDQIPRYIACSRITKRQIFEFVSSSVRPNDKIQVFALPDDYSFGIVSSSLHWRWFTEKCTTL